MSGPRMMATDLDGTLLDSGSRLSERARAALVELGYAGVVRVIATGRSLFSARKVIEVDWPIDYLVFSSGAGVIDWRTQRLLRSVQLSREEAQAGVELMLGMELDFMLHGPVPDNHRFWYRRTSRDNTDFERRVALYASSATAWPTPGMPAIVDSLERDARGAAFTQLLAVAGPQAKSLYTEVAHALPAQSVILSTSPLDHASWWIEIFPAEVSKSQAVAWLCRECGVARSRVTALGNDYNDEDLLTWAASGWLVRNAAAPLLARFPSVSSNDEDGFAEAVGQLLGGG